MISLRTASSSTCGNETMHSDGAVDPELTEEQISVVMAPSSERQIVLAPAGSGKTHVLIQRVEHLIGSEGLAGGDELILLTFSRAIVQELRRRASSSGGEARFATISTFDSFATRLLSEELPESAFSHLGYDDRIKLATKIIGDATTTCAGISFCRHILVDEVQDVVGDRAEMVLALLLRTDCGFTLLGDLAQSLYEFRSGSLGPMEMLDRIRASYREELIDRRFSDSFRARSDSARRALTFGPMLIEPTLDSESLAHDLRTFELDLPTFGSLQEMKRLLVSNRASTVIMARTNGQALLASEELHRLGVEHQVQPTADRRLAASWIARAFARLDSSTLSPTRADRLLQEAGVASIEEREAAIASLLRLSRRGK